MKKLNVESILEMSRHFMTSRILLTGAELDLFTLLSIPGLPAEEVARKTGGELRPLTILLDALSATGLLVKKKGRYYCPTSISPFLSKNSPDSILPMIHHTVHLWERWSGLTRMVCPSYCAPEPGSSEERKKEELGAFIGAMNVIGSQMAPEIVSAVKPGKTKNLIDVGGASGTYTLAFLRAAPKMKATLFDRPPVIEMARRRLTEAGVIGRVNLAGGDFYQDDLPPGHDLAFLSAIIHQNSPGQNVDLYGKIFRSLEPGGRIVIRDHIMDPDRTRPRDGAIFAVNMLVGTSGGNTYTLDEIRSGLEKAGFIKVRLLRKGEHMDGLVEGFKPR